MYKPNILEIFLSSAGVAIDTRKIIPGQIFFALKGDQTNGNVYAETAIQQGASYAVIDDIKYSHIKKTILVQDSLKTLQELATSYRNMLQIPILAITGSNGKTTTKELACSVLNKKYKTFATQGNLNNHIGVPLSILSIKTDHDFAIIEMGANHQKEIEFLCTIARPTYGLITNIGKAHLEGFGGEEGVLKGKTELYHYLQAHNRVLFVNSNQEKLYPIYKNYKKFVSYGFKHEDFLSGSIIANQTFASIEMNGLKIESHLVGKYNAENILAAACIGKYFEVPFLEIKQAIESYIPKNSRSEWKEINGNYFILDAYNANPSSMEAAIENFKLLNVSPKIAILGDMLEMGEFADAEHAKILELILDAGCNEIITVGTIFKKAVHDKKVKAFENILDAKKYFNEKKYLNFYILLKGSRGIALEKLIQ